MGAGLAALAAVKRDRDVAGLRAKRQIERVSNTILNDLLYYAKIDLWVKEEGEARCGVFERSSEVGVELIRKFRVLLMRGWSCRNDTNTSVICQLRNKFGTERQFQPRVMG